MSARAAIRAATAVAAVAFAGVGTFGQAGAARPGAPNAGPPQVICRPCGEVPPPKGYSCSGSVMIAASVATKDIPRMAATCHKSEPPGAADKKSQNAEKAPASKTKGPASKTHCNKKKKAAAHNQPPVPNS